MQKDRMNRDQLPEEPEAARESLAQPEESKTKLEHVEDELRQSEELQRIALSSISDVILITDDAGSLTFVSPNVDAALGYSVEEVLRLGNITRLLGSVPPVPTEPGPDREAHDFERDISDKDGKSRVLLVNAKRVPIGDGSVLYACRDITDLRRDQEELRRHRDRLGKLIDERAAEQGVTNELLEQRNKLLSALSRVQTRFIADVDPRLLFDQLLDELLLLTASEYGFIGQVLHTPDGEPYLKTHAIANLSWGGQVGWRHESEESTATEFQDLRAFVAAVMSSGKHIIVRDPVTDLGGRDTSEGRPRANTFLGLPLHNGKGLVGMVGIGNRPGGYDPDLIEFLEPFLATCANLIEAHRNVQERQQAENELARSERNFRNSIDNSPLGTSIVTRDGKLIYANQAFLDIYDYDCIEKLRAVPLRRRYTRQSYVEHQQRRGKMHSGEPVPSAYELSIVRRGGEVRHLSVSWSGVRWDGERRFLVIYQDVTERKQSHNALRESEERLRAFCSALPDVAFVLDENGGIVEVLTADESLLYRDAPSIKGRTLHEVLPEDVADLGVETVRRTLETGEVQSLEYELAVPAGERQFEGRMAPMQMEAEGKKTVVVLSRDITERKRAEEILQKNAASLSNAQRMARLGNWHWDIKSNAFHLSKEGHRILDLAPGRITEPYEVLSGVVHPDDRENAQRSAVQALSEGRPYDHDYRIVRSNGSEAVVHVRGEFTFDDTGAPLRAAGTVQDITELRDLERRGIEYQELNHVKSNLLSTVSHELRTPLSIIKGYSTLLLDYEDRLENEEKREYLDSIDRATDRLTELVDHILDMSRLESGLLQLELSPASIAKLAREAAAEARVRAPNHKIRLILAKRLPQMNVDAKRIRQVLDNIIDNAVKYSPEGTEIVVSAQRKGDELVVSISDQGIGIPAGDLDRVFDRMYRIEHGLVPTVEGAGLGLSICKGLVDRHRGHIWMESEEGRGTTCHFALPIENGKA